MPNTASQKLGPAPFALLDVIENLVELSLRDKGSFCIFFCEGITDLLGLSFDYESTQELIVDIFLNVYTAGAGADLVSR